MNRDKKLEGDEGDNFLIPLILLISAYFFCSP
jgi:hypothetical protein